MEIGIGVEQVLLGRALAQLAQNQLDRDPRATGLPNMILGLISIPSGSAMMSTPRCQCRMDSSANCEQRGAPILTRMHAQEWSTRGTFT
jgi:hypothetical protein